MCVIWRNPLDLNFITSIVAAAAVTLAYVHRVSKKLWKIIFVRTLSNVHQLWNFLAQRYADLKHLVVLLTCCVDCCALTWIRWDGKWVHLTHNFSLFAIFVPKIFAIGGTLMKFWQKWLYTIFFRRDVAYLLHILLATPTASHSQSCMSVFHLLCCMHVSLLFASC